jgi:predicted NBD/HSP70 family sugar kinase
LCHGCVVEKKEGGPAAIGVDLGDTKTEAILLATDGFVLYRESLAIEREDGYDAMLRNIVKLIGAAGFKF